MILLVTNTGAIVYVHSDDLADLADLGDATTRRASNVEPVPGGGWSADMGPVGGPVLLDAGRPFRLRADALDAERAYLAGILAAGASPGGIVAEAVRVGGWPCPACRGSLDGRMDGDGICDGCGHLDPAS